jgi:2-polyprenyl-3-methyl-5-hydroxy-6-metoxy-1,4-benzoquinol methylase
MEHGFDAIGSGQYDANYGHFDVDVYEQVRREAFGEDIGQNSWLTVDEQERFLAMLGLSAGQKLLDVGCGAGGPVLRAAARTGCSVVGVDVHEQAIATARTLADRRGLVGAATFFVADASRRLPFDDAAFDAITCIDAINHLPDRQKAVGDWVRMLKPGGRLLVTDPTIVTGPVAHHELATRSSTGFYLFVPPDYDASVLAQCGLRVILSENRTGNMADVAERRRAARESRRDALRAVEGEATFDSHQAFLATAALTAKENRLSRFVFVAEKPREGGAAVSQGSSP